MSKKTIAENLKYYRKSKGYSQEELSYQTEVSIRTIQRIENEEVKPHLNTLKLLALALDVEVKDLLPLENPKYESVRKKWLLLLHATPLLGYFIPFTNVLFPLFLWIHKREDHPVYDQHGVRVINFQISALIYSVLALAALLLIETGGFFIFIGTILFCLASSIFNIFYVINKDKSYYPLSIPFFRAQKDDAISR